MKMITDAQYQSQIILESFKDVMILLAPKLIKKKKLKRDIILSTIKNIKS